MAVGVMYDPATVTAKSAIVAVPVAMGPFVVTTRLVPLMTVAYKNASTTLFVTVTGPWVAIAPTELARFCVAVVLFV